MSSVTYEGRWKRLSPTPGPRGLRRGWGMGGFRAAPPPTTFLFTCFCTTLSRCFICAARRGGERGDSGAMSRTHPHSGVSDPWRPRAHDSYVRAFLVA